MITKPLPPLSLALYTQYEGSILAAREKFYGYFQKNYSTATANIIAHMLDHRVKSSATPLLGELWPWFLQRIFPTKPGFEKEFDLLVTQWLALYLLVVEFDSAADNKKPISVAVTMPLIVEASELIALDPLISRKAVIAQMHDIKGVVTPEKNAFIGLLAQKVSSLSCFQDVRTLNEMTGMAMQTLLQIMDDLCDISEDIQQGRTSSVIQTGLFRANQTRLHRGLIELLLENNPSVYKSVTEALGQLTTSAFQMVSALAGHENRRKIDLKVERDFFASIGKEASSLRNYIATTARHDILFAEEVKSRFAILGQST